MRKAEPILGAQTRGSRHEKHRPSECRRVSPAKAEEKRRKTLGSLRGVQDGGEIRENFSQRTKKLFPESSK